MDARSDNTQTAPQTHDVGGIRLDRPFRIRRLGHFGYNVMDVEACLPFYTDLLGLAISDSIDFGRIFELDEKEVGSGVGYLFRHGTDHHSFVVFPKRALDARPGRPPIPDEVTINQITWQVGSLREVVDATAWFARQGTEMTRQGRDVPGSNWHVYPLGPDRHINELYYGIEQIGWNGHSKPKSMYGIRYEAPPELPHISEFQEVEKALADGVDVDEGQCHRDQGEAVYDVGGILLARPFKITGMGPVRLFVDDMAASLAYYRDRLGLTLSEEVIWQGHRCHFLRANTEHHSLALYPKALRAELGLSPHTTLMAYGMRVADYGQLRAAITFLGGKGVGLKYLPPELFPGIDYSVLAIDPDGHAIQLYYYMEQIGWDGRPRPPGQRRQVDNQNWPETLEPLSDTHMGEVFLGPLG